MIYGEAQSPQHCKGSQPLCVCKISDLMDVRNLRPSFRTAFVGFRHIGEHFCAVHR
jgi:hypothetical protein